MVSLGGGALVPAIVGLYLIMVVVGYCTGELDRQYLMVPLLLLTFGWFVHDVNRHYGKY